MSSSTVAQVLLALALWSEIISFALGEAMGLWAVAHFATRTDPILKKARNVLITAACSGLYLAVLIYLISLIGSGGL